MRIPLGGKSVPFRVTRRRGSGMSSVVFECRREISGGGGGGGGGDGCPEVVTVKVGRISSVTERMQAGSHVSSLLRCLELVL